MSIMLCTLVLNEEEWLRKNYEQHKDWPGLTRWVFVESADFEYQRANPSMVSEVGLSIDRTTEIIADIESKDDRVTHVRFGYSHDQSPEKGKRAARQVYMEIAKIVKPDFMVLHDADEFYTYEDQGRINNIMAGASQVWDSFLFKKREIWRPPSITEELVPRWEVVKGFWNIPCCHWWRWVPGMHHRDCHNTPTLPTGRPVNRHMLRFDDTPGTPQMLHMGFASGSKTRAAKNKYYADRGEAKDRKRAWHVESRAAWESWKPGDVLPRGAQVIPYVGPIPECFL